MVNSQQWMCGGRIGKSMARLREPVGLLGTSAGKIAMCPES